MLRDKVENFFSINDFPVLYKYLTELILDYIQVYNFINQKPVYFTVKINC
jgi:hypothetical protein